MSDSVVGVAGLSKPLRVGPDSAPKVLAAFLAIVKAKALAAGCGASYVQNTAGFT
jgi:hypothetical protein